MSAQSGNTETAAAPCCSEPHPSAAQPPSSGVRTRVGGAVASGPSPSSSAPKGTKRVQDMTVEEQWQYFRDNKDKFRKQLERDLRHEAALKRSIMGFVIIISCLAIFWFTMKHYGLLEG